MEKRWFVSNEGHIHGRSFETKQEAVAHAENAWGEGKAVVYEGTPVHVVTTGAAPRTSEAIAA